MKFLERGRENRKAPPVENGGIKFIQAVPISRKSCALKAGIRALGTTHPSNSHHRCLLLSFPAVLLFYCEPEADSQSDTNVQSEYRDRFCMSAARNTIGERKKSLDTLRIYSESSRYRRYYFNKSHRIKRKNAGKILSPKIFSIFSRLDFIFA